MYCGRINYYLKYFFVSPTSSKSTTASSSSNSKEEITNVKVALNWQPSAISETKSTLITNVLEVTNIPKRSYSNHRLEITIF